MLFKPEEHAANPPATWKVVKVAARRWSLTTKDGAVLNTYSTKLVAESERTSGFYVDLYEKERRWFAGESIPGWKPWKPASRLEAPHARPAPANGRGNHA